MQMREVRPSDWSEVGDSAANGALTVTKAAPGEAGESHCATAFEVVISGAAAAADITVELKSGATVKWRSVIGSGAARGARVSKSFPNPIACGIGEAVTLTATAGGIGVICSGSLAGFTR